MKALADLNHFTGTENYFRHPFSKVVYTDGVKYVADNAGAYWLIDAILSYRRTEPFQVWELKLIQAGGAVLTMKEDSGQPILVTQEIPVTDFPMPISMWITGGVLMLPSEY